MFPHSVLCGETPCLTLRGAHRTWDEGWKCGEINDSLGFPSGSVVKNLLAIQEMWVQSLGQKHPLEQKW